MRIATTVSEAATRQALKVAMDASEIPMDFDIGLCESGEVAAVITPDKTLFSRWVAETFEVPEGAVFYKLRT